MDIVDKTSVVYGRRVSLYGQMEGKVYATLAKSVQDKAKKGSISKNFEAYWSVGDD